MSVDVLKCCSNVRRSGYGESEIQGWEEGLTGDEAVSVDVLKMLQRCPETERRDAVSILGRGESGVPTSRASDRYFLAGTTVAGVM